MMLVMLVSLSELTIVSKQTFIPSLKCQPDKPSRKVKIRLCLFNLCKGTKWIEEPVYIFIFTERLSECWLIPFTYKYQLTLFYFVHWHRGKWKEYINQSSALGKDAIRHEMRSWSETGKVMEMKMREEEQVLCNNSHWDEISEIRFLIGRLWFIEVVFQNPAALRRNLGKSSVLSWLGSSERSCGCNPLSAKC